MTMDLKKIVGNDVNGATFQRGGGTASGRGGDNRATQVVNRRKPCSRRYTWHGWRGKDYQMQLYMDM